MREIIKYVTITWDIRGEIMPILQETFDRKVLNGFQPYGNPVASNGRIMQAFVKYAPLPTFADLVGNLGKSNKDTKVIKDPASV